MAGAPRDSLLFCPFCRECFEEKTHCPEHDLELVSFERLPKESGRDTPRDDERLAPYDPRFGRGIVAAGVLITLAGAFMPLVSRTMRDIHTTYDLSAIDMAVMRIAPNLWTVPLACVVLIAILLRRRTLASLRGTRLVAPIIGLMPAGSVAFTWFQVERGVAAALAHRGIEMAVQLEVGAYAIVIGSLVMAIGGVRLGVLRRGGTALPHGARPDAQGAGGAAGIVVDREHDDDI